MKVGRVRQRIPTLPDDSGAQPVRLGPVSDRTRRTMPESGKIAAAPSRRVPRIGIGMVTVVGRSGRW